MKTLRKREEYNVELEALKKIRNQKKNHLTSLLAAYETDNKQEFCLLFHWADGGNLRQFWEQQSHHDLDMSWFCWMAEQCRGLADGLSGIHCAKLSHEEMVAALGPELGPIYEDVSLNNAKGDERDYGRHGDIKPQNILWFCDDPNRWGHGVLKLTDFGIATFHRKETTTVLKIENAKATSTFMPPEFPSKKFISRAYDVWSLGCVYMDFITWAIFGDTGVQEYRKKRIEDKGKVDENLKVDTSFHRTNLKEPGQYGGRVKASVQAVRNFYLPPWSPWSFRFWPQ